MPKFEILQKKQSLFHADKAIDLEAHVRHRTARVYVTDDVFSDDIQSWCLSIKINKQLSDLDNVNKLGKGKKFRVLGLLLL